MKRKTVSLLICFVMLFSLLPSIYATTTITASGTCGENLTWELDSEGVLVISGSGKMDDWGTVTNIDTVPWYSYKNKIKSVIVDSGVLNIGENAFWRCENLTHIEISDGVTSIGKSAFSNCHALVSITIPNSVTSIEALAFGFCRNLSSVILPDGLTGISDHTFIYCDSLTSIAIPNKVTSIGGSAFCYCTKLTNLDIPDGVTRIGTQAFDGCNALESITIPNSVTSIEEMAFNDCTNLSDVYYKGKSDSWDKINIETYNEDMLNATIHYIYTVSYNANGGYNAPKSQTKEHGSDFVISTVVPLREGHIFKGWATSSDGVAEYVPGEIYFGANDVTLYAVWEKITYTVKYNANGGVSAPVSQTKTYGEPLVLSAVAPVRDGYAFKGWSASATGEVSYVSGATYSEDANITLYAVWKEKINYFFGQTVQIGLIEPWFLKANVRVYTEDEPTNIDYSALIDYGAYFIRKSELDVENATQDTLEASDIINDSDTVKHSKSAGTATIDGSYLTATYNKGLYTYEFDDSVFVMFYIEDENGITYIPIRERNLLSLLEERKDDVEEFPNEYERGVYKNMLNMYNSIKQYRDDYYKNNQKGE